MSKHVKALRTLSTVVRGKWPAQPGYTTKCWDEAEAAADHMERLEAQLRIARKVLKRVKHHCHDHHPVFPVANVRAFVDEAEKAMRKAAKKGK